MVGEIRFDFILGTNSRSKTWETLICIWLAGVDVSAIPERDTLDRLVRKLEAPVSAGFSRVLVARVSRLLEQ